MKSESPSGTLGYAWFVVVLLVPVALLNYLDRQMLATMKASMVGDIPSIANRADWGLILGAFKWTYAVLSPFGGYVADRFSRRWVIGGSLFMWSLVTWWTGHVTSFHELLAARALMGISEAFYIPAALALITEYHYGDTRSRAVGLHQSGIYLGQILGGFAGYMADSPDHGWRWAFSTCGMLGIAYAIPLLALVRDPVRK
ncbi:MAG TPA: MFS transporter, partial [Opitutus sp.]|nr:MFS transporter [Opitutus sp.]